MIRMPNLKKNFITFEISFHKRRIFGFQNIKSEDNPKFGIKVTEKSPL